MYDHQITIWNKEIAKLEKVLKISYPGDVHEEAREQITRYKQAIAARTAEQQA